MASPNLSSIKRCCYILPTNLEHKGITLKVNGQCKSLSKQFQISLIHLTASHTSSRLFRLLDYFRFELKACWAMLFHPLVYIRYNPKAPLVNLLACVLSYFKPVYIEHNVIMDTELLFLGRRIEHELHLLTLSLLSWSRCYHCAVNAELKLHLESKGLPQKRIIYSQNGYSPPTASDPDMTVTEQLSPFRKAFKTLAIFSGNGYPWHGLDDILEHLKAFPDIGLIVVGPYETIVSDSILQFKSLRTPALIHLIEQCDFAISTFRYDLISVSEGSPLKSRQYLCHGCPIVVNYYDSALDFNALTPYIFNFQTLGVDAFNQACGCNADKDSLKVLAQDCLSWDRYFQRLFELKLH